MFRRRLQQRRTTRPEFEILLHSLSTLNVTLRWVPRVGNLSAVRSRHDTLLYSPPYGTALSIFCNAIEIVQRHSATFSLLDRVEEADELGKILMVEYRKKPSLSLIRAVHTCETATVPLSETPL